MWQYTVPTTAAEGSCVFLVALAFVVVDAKHNSARAKSQDIVKTLMAIEHFVYCI